MREVRLSNSTQLAIVDGEDYTKVSEYKWRLSTSGYAVSGRGSCFSMHRLINETPDSLHTDHINRDRLDNRKSNLRSVTHADNMKNKVRYGSKRPNIHFEKSRDKWHVRRYIEGKRVFIGRFNSREEALKSIGV